MVELVYEAPLIPVIFALHIHLIPLSLERAFFRSGGSGKATEP